MPRGPRPHAGGEGAEEAAPFFFEGIESPNGTIFPDALLDHVMPFLSPSEWKVCSYIVRRTFGWKKASDRISLDQICHGIVRRDGTALDYGTRLDRKTAIKALRGLEAKGVIVARRNYSAERGFEATTYGLRFRGQPPTRTLGEKFPQGLDDQGEIFHQGASGMLPQATGEDLHQASGAAPEAPVASLHPQPTASTTNTARQCGDQDETATTGADSAEAGRRPRRARGAASTDARVVDAAAAVAASDATVRVPASGRARREAPSAKPHGPAGVVSALGGGRPRHRQGAVVPTAALSTEDAAGVAPAFGPGAIPLPDEQPGVAALWAEVLARLAAQMSAANYQTWLADTCPLGQRGRTLVVGAPSGFVCEWLRARFHPLVRRALLAVAPQFDDVAFVVGEGYTP